MKALYGQAIPPEAWRAGMQAELGIAPSDDRDGCLQDVHWFFERIGGEFQGYTIGNILSAQFFAAATKAHPNILSESRADSSAHYTAGSPRTSIATDAASRWTRS